MTMEPAYFVIFYLVSLIGFSICLRGPFFDERGNTSNSSTALGVIHNVCLV